MSMKPSPPAKVPQPERLDQVYEALRKGLQSYLSVNQKDLNSLNNRIKELKRDSRLGFLYEFDKQVKVIEANMKRLEIHQNKSVGLYQGYCQQKKLRDEASKMMKSCKASSGDKEAKESFVKAKAQKDYKEYTEKMCTLENAIQNQLGQLHIQMKGLAGFARLCAGDQYEICMKYGRQRWKMRGSIEINSKQEWESQKIMFYPQINEFLYLKVTELKSLTNHVVVGNIVCEIKDLFTPLPQVVAVDINELGTIKLVLEVNWNPVSKDDSESLTSSEMISILSPAENLTPSSPSTPLDTPTLTPKGLNLEPPRHEISWNKVSESSPPPPASAKGSVYEVVDQPSEGAEYPSSGSLDHTPSETGSLMGSGLDDDLEVLISTLDVYREQFPDLQKLADELRRLQVTLKGCRHRQSSTSNHSVQSALSSFDFLTASDCEDEWGETCSKMSRNGRPPTRRGQHSGSFSSFTTGSTALDCSLIVHLNNCRAQIDHLGGLGPLRCRETYALDKLLREARVFKIISRIVEDNPQHFRQPTQVIPELGLCQDAVSLWQQCVGSDSVYCVPADHLLMTLSSVYSSMLCERTEAVLSSLVERILEQKLPLQSDRDEPLVTLFQLWNYLESNGITDMEMHIIELAEEVWLLENLSTWDQDVILDTLRSPAECSLKREGTQAVAKLLADPRDKVSASASSVLRILAADPRQREQALVNCMEMLEEDDLNSRVCGCKALACLKAKESVDQLLYLRQVDEEEVQDAATQTLQELGEEGEEAFRHLEEIPQASPPDPLEQWSAQPSSSTQDIMFF